MKNPSSETLARASKHKRLRLSNVVSLRKKISLSYNATQELPERWPRYLSVDEMVQQMRPDMPVYCIRPDVITSTAQLFLRSFPGDVLYAVKTNPDARVLKHIVRAGVTHFDAASIAEVASAFQACPTARIYFMHPVKSREAIRVAYYEYGVRDFSLDSEQELQKILDCTHHAKDLNLYVRLAVENGEAAYSLSGKFGATLYEAEALLRSCREAANKLGVCFHVGSQCMQPRAYAKSIALVARLIKKAGVTLDVLDVGGGFPAIYPGLTPPPLSLYMKAIKKAIRRFSVFNACQIICEPGRAIVAEAGSTIARVELRKGNVLYLNEGTYGSLFDAGFPGFVFPVKAIRSNNETVELLHLELAEFSLFGPTCDSLDSMKGPFYLPENIAEGDWIEFGQLGSYGTTMRTNFNGFQSDIKVEVHDQPILTNMGVN